MAARLSVLSDSSYSASSSFSFSSGHWKNARIRTLPRRGQVKAKIFGSIVASIASFLGVRVKGGSANEEGAVDMADSRLSFDEGTKSHALDMSASSTPGSNGSNGSPHSRTISFDGHLRV